MRVIFMGTTPFSKVVLQELVNESFEVIALVTQPDRPFGRKRELKAPITKEFALKHNIKVLQPNKIKDSIKEINDLNADLIVTCAYGQIVPIEILNHPKHKSINVHASLLPKYRGGAPIHWSIINGDCKTGMTLMEMDAGMDSGNIITQEEVDIEVDDTMGTLEKKLMLASQTLIKRDLKAYLQGDIESQKQAEDQVTYAYTIKKEDELIDFKQDVEKVYNRMRGLIPWPVSYALLEGERVKFHQVKMIKKHHNLVPGSITDIHEEGMDIACLNGFVRISKIQPFGKPVMTSIDFMNGFKESWKGKIFS